MKPFPIRASPAGSPAETMRYPPVAATIAATRLRTANIRTLLFGYRNEKTVTARASKIISAPSNPCHVTTGGPAAKEEATTLADPPTAVGKLPDPAM